MSNRCHMKGLEREIKAAAKEVKSWPKWKQDINISGETKYPKETTKPPADRVGTTSYDELDKDIVGILIGFAERMQVMSEIPDIAFGLAFTERGGWIDTVLTERANKEIRALIKKRGGSTK